MSMKTKESVSLFQSPRGGTYFRPFAMITSLFLLWGFAHGLLDVLDKHFQNTLHVSKAQSGMVQFSLYIGYLVMAGPAGSFMKKQGYKKGIILGLILFALGAFLFYPAAKLVDTMFHNDDWHATCVLLRNSHLKFSLESESNTAAILARPVRLAARVLLCSTWNILEEPIPQGINHPNPTDFKSFFL